MKGNGKFYVYDKSPVAVTLRIISKGSGTVIMNGIKRTVKKNDMFCAVPGTPIQFYESPTDPWQWYELQFSGEGAIPLVKLLGFTKNNHSLSLENPLEVMDYFRKIHECFSKDRRSPWEALSLLYKLIDACTANPEITKTGRESRKMLLIRAHDMLESMPSARLNVSELAGELNVDRTTLRRAFKKQYGMPPIDFLKSVRIIKAKEILRETEFPLAKVADLTGFSNAKYFIRCFRNEVGLTPERWRKQNS